MIEPPQKMKYFKSASILLCLFSLASCAVPTTGVIPLQDGIYKIVRQGSSAFIQLIELKSAAFSEADDFCKSKGRTLRTVDSTQREARGLGGWPEAEIIFKCV